MVRAARLSLAAIGICTAVGLVGQPMAAAQDDGGSEAGVFEDAPVESSAPGEDLERKIRGLRWGVAISTVAIPLGTGMFLGGAASCVGSSLFGSCSTGEKLVYGFGIAFMIAGTAGMITTAILLRRRKEEQRGLHANRRLHWDVERGSFVF